MTGRPGPFRSSRHPANWLACVLFGAILAVASKSGAADRDVAPTFASVLPDDGWTAVFNRADGWTGADVAGTVDLGDGRTLWVFGDTWIGSIRDGKRVAGARLVNNSIAVHPTAQPQPWLPPAADAIRFYWGHDDAKGRPTAWLVPAAASSDPNGTSGQADWFWPTGGGVVLPGDKSSRRLALFFFRVRRNPGQQGIWNFTVVGSTMALIDNAAERPERWTARTVDVFHQHTGPPRAEGADRDDIVWGLAAIGPGDASQPTLVVGARPSRSGAHSLVLSRVGSAGIERPGDWAFFAGDGRWSNEAARAQSLADGVPSELSLEPLSGGPSRRWVLVHSEGFFGRKILARTAERPEGPWSRAHPIYAVPDVLRDRSYFTYSAKGHALLSRPDELLVTYLVNSQRFGDLMTDTTIYRPKFVRVPRTILFPR